MQDFSRHINGKAILAGFAVNFVVTLLLALVTEFVLLVGFFMSKHEHHVPPAETHAALISLHSTPLYFVVSLAFGAFADFVGGFVTGRVAGHDEERHGIAMALFSCAVSLVVLLLLLTRHPLSHPLHDVLSFVVAVPCAYLGARCARTSQRTQQLFHREGPIPLP